MIGDGRVYSWVPCRPDVSLILGGFEALIALVILRALSDHCLNGVKFLTGIF